MIARCVCGEPLITTRGEACDLGRWSGRKELDGVFVCADKRTAPLRPRAVCLRMFSEQRPAYVDLSAKLDAERAATSSLWKSRKRIASAAALLVFCWSASSDAVQNKSGAVPRRPLKSSSAPKTCDPKSPAACDGSPSRCYCPGGGECTCVVRMTLRCSTCSPRSKECPQGMSCACSEYGCCCE